MTIEVLIAGVAQLGLSVVLVLVFVRYMLRKLDEQSAYIVTMQAEHKKEISDVNSKLIGTVERNTIALERNTKVMERLVGQVGATTKQSLN